MVLINQCELEDIGFIRVGFDYVDLDIAKWKLFTAIKISMIGLLAPGNLRIRLASFSIIFIRIHLVGFFAELMLIIFICLILLSTRSPFDDEIR